MVIFRRWSVFVTFVLLTIFTTLIVSEDTSVTTKDEVQDVDDADASESRVMKKDKRLRKKVPTITIPIKNAVVQALAPVERHEAEAASHKPSRDSYDDPGGGYGGVVGDIVYEDELPGDLEGWIPPPPPPPDTLFRRPSYSSPHHHLSSSSFTRLASMRPHFSSSRLFGDDFALFLVILTIAGFFGLMLAMFMPFTFLMNQQPVGIGVGQYPYGQVTGASGVYGYPPYGRRRRSLGHEQHAFRHSGSADFFFRLLMQALEKYDGHETNNRRWRDGWHVMESSLVPQPLLWPSADSQSSAVVLQATSSPVFASPPSLKHM